MNRSYLGFIGFALGLGAATALAQARSDWTVACAEDGAKRCTAKSEISYRAGAMLMVAPKTFSVSLRDDPAKPLVSMKLTDTEVRYARFRLDQPIKMNDMICDGVDCSMSFVDARDTIDGLKAGRRAAILLFTNDGQVVQVGISTDGLADAIERTRPK
jgi:invasion protein IalB